MAGVSVLQQMLEDVPLDRVEEVRESVARVVEYCKAHYKDVSVTDQAENAVCKDVLEFVKGHRELRANETAVDRSILPKDCTSMVIVDIRVRVRGPDDRVFLHNKEIRDRIARGNTILELRVNGETLFIPVLQGLRKFTGGLGDDDDMPAGPDMQAAWKSYFLAPIEQAHTIFSMEKANGEAAHLACRWIKNKFVILCGSKNVHLCVTKRSDIAKYTDDKFRMATLIARVVFDHLERLDDKGQALLSFLACTQLTANFELLQPTYQHVELLGDKPRLLFFAFTAHHFDGNRASLCDVHPLVGIEIMRVLGMDTVGYEVVPFARFEAHSTDVRKTFGKEGRVLYILDSDTTRGNVIGLFKKKTIWYVVLRAIREKVKTAVARLVKTPDTPLPEVRSACIRRTNARLRNIQQWLGFSKEALEGWIVMAKMFIEWVLSEEHLAFDAVAQRDKYRPRARRTRQEDAASRRGNDGAEVHEEEDGEDAVLVKFTPEDVSSLFPKVWDAFLRATKAKYP